MRRILAILATAAALLAAPIAPVLAVEFFEEGPTTGTVTVTKQIIPDGEDSGPLSPSQFHLFVGETAVTSGVPTSMSPGTYSVHETEESNYIFIGYSGNCGGDAAGQVTVFAGGSRTCTIINQYVRPQPPAMGTVTIQKIVDNERGGQASSEDFTFFVSQMPVALNTATPFLVGTYQVTETGPGNYSASYSTGCPGGSVAVLAEQNVDCTITNTYIPPREGPPPGGGGGNTSPPTLTIVTQVTNDDAGTKGPADFPASVASGSMTLAVPGAGALGASVILSSGAYLVTPAADLGYGSTMSAGCSGSLTDGVTAVCTIAYNDLPLTIEPPEEPSPFTPPTEPEPPVDVTPTDDGTSTPPVVLPPPPSNPPRPAPPSPLVLGVTDVAPDAELTIAATDTEPAPAPEPTPPVLTDASSGAKCVWFWGWFGCYWWILLLVAIILYLIRRAVRQMREKQKRQP